MAGDTKQRITTATIELFRQHGYNGTGLKQVTQAAGAPFGSLYHHFPGGKEELAATALTEAGIAYRELFEAIYDAAPDAGAAISDFFEGAADVLRETGYLDICPIGTVASEVASTNDRLREVSATIFGDWHNAATRRLQTAGASPDLADDLATTLIATLEGAFILARAARDTEPLHRAGRVMRGVVERALVPVDQSAAG